MFEGSIRKEDSVKGKIHVGELATVGTLPPFDLQCASLGGTL